MNNKQLSNCKIFSGIAIAVVFVASLSILGILYVPKVSGVMMMDNKTGMMMDNPNSGMMMDNKTGMMMDNKTGMMNGQP